MGERSYEIDDQGNLVEHGAAAPVASAPSDQPKPAQVVTREGIRSVMRAIVLSEVLVVLFLGGAAVYYADMRALLLSLAAGYAVMAAAIAVIVRRSMLKRLGQPLQED
jgi:hypothetical protein